MSFNATITIDHKTSIIAGDFGALSARMSLGLEGRKNWISPSKLRFETSEHNVRVLLSLLPTAVVQDKRLSPDDAKALEDLASHSLPTPAPAFVMKPRDFQLENFERFKTKLQWAIFSEQGTGKTKVAIDIISFRWLIRMITGVIILSSPKGVHSQWVDEQLPKHLWKNVQARSYIWDDRKPPSWLGTPTPDELQIVSGNIDMVKGKKGRELLEAFARQHGKKLLFLVDESDSIKNFLSGRSVAVQKLAEGTEQRAIMTGTPIAKDLTDEFGQFYFLNKDIIGHKYISSFKAQFCIMGGFENQAVVGAKNVDQLKRLTAPFIFRATKADLNLPPKVYDSVVFDMSATQKRLIRELREQFFSSLASGATVAVKNGAALLLRAQQISNGFMVDEYGEMHSLDNPRLDALVDLRRQIGGPVIIWCRFQEDVRIVKRAFSNSAVTIYGEMKQADRDASKTSFISGAAQELVATAGAAGKGVDGLQAVCSDAIYYSNSFNAIDRWQSEDRIDRIGSIGTSRYFDLIGRGSGDRGILRNLKHKKDISSLALDDLKQIWEEMGQ